ncbi:MAG: PVC-type heme-binding CxxCH protein [Planctomycetota bacterium]
MLLIACSRSVFAGRSLLLTMTLGLLLAPTALWAQRDLKNIPDPDPELERKTFIVPEGFEVNLWAGDPLMAKPIGMNFDERGRLWVASSEVYPQIKPGQEATDKVLVLEDTDGDGKADKTTVFADGLLIPTGVLPGDGGVYVVNSTELLHLKDTDGDGKADTSRIVLSGFGTEDTHHLLHSLRWGHDGCIYMNQSIYIHSHVETPYGVKHLNGGGIWRFRPETLQLDILCYGFVNAWGHHFDRWGQSFATDGAYGEGINYVFPGSVFFTAVGAKRIINGLNPGSPKHCGLEIVGGSHLPADWQGNMITNDFRAHRVCRFVVTEDGSGYSSRQEVEVIKSTHPAFRPIDVKMGPDGAIYIADWYNPIIQHGEVDFRDPRRDHVHGRIWRVTAKGRPTSKLPKLADAAVPELLNQLKAEEEWVRLHAKLQLKQRGPAAVVPALKAWVAALPPDDPNREHHRLEALWTYQNLEVVEPGLLEELCHSPDHRVRAAAIRVTSLWLPRLTAPLELLRAGVADSHPRVRLEAVRALALVPTVEAATLALRVLDQPLDRFLDFAVWQTMRDLEPIWLPAVRDGRTDLGGNVDHLTFALKAVESPGVVAPLLDLIRKNKISADRVDSILSLIASLGGPKELGNVFELVVNKDSMLAPAAKASLLNALVETSLRRKTNPEGDLNRVAELFGSPDGAVRAAAARAVGAWKLAAHREQLQQWALGAPQDATAEQIALSQAAMEGIAQLGGAASIELLTQLTDAARPATERVKAIAMLVNLDVPRAAQRAAVLLAEGRKDVDPIDVVSNLLAQKNGATALGSAVSAVKLSPDVARLAVRAAQAAAVPSPELVESLRKAGGLTAGGWKLTPELSQALVAEAATSGNPARGEAVFRRKDLQCLKCHAVGGAGGKVGPDLVSIGASAPVDYLVESLLEPNKKVKENYHSVLVETDEGKVITGIVARESKTELVVRDAEDRLITIPTASIEQKRDGRSLMPDGAIDALTRQELVDLVRFLSELGKVGGEYAVGRARVVRRWQTLVFTRDAHHLLDRTSHDSAAQDRPELVWEPAYSRVQGDLPLGDLPKFHIHTNNNPTTFVRFQVDVSQPGVATLRLGEFKGLSLWLDGKPTPISAADLPLELTTGLHTITLAVNQAVYTQPLRVELVESASSPVKLDFVTGK